ncbi:GNAT family N-acetyltransferase [Mycobacterium asiaticum]|uniref:GNAT family N-acetyltransferase n=1 Tax=Mycobacterium asiaticum TaxID=1790 RepID=UPI000A0E5D2A|nr:GNAT family N-acetyltransferase [Mycobacterium asiaticum DSM 44297]
MCSLRVELASAADAAGLSAVASQTFPLACPPHAPAADVAAFVEANLSTARFAEYLSDPHRRILKADEERRIVGYAMLIREADESDVSVELSKLYVTADFHGHGVATKLMDAALGVAAEWGASRVWLGVNRHNLRAQRFYAKSGFTVSGTRTFRLGAHLEHDYVMTRAAG